MRSLRSLALILAVPLASLAPGRARAWTDATVRSASAHVDVAPDGTAEVEIVARLRVDGGWLESFELDGLDPDLALREDAPPTFVDELTGARLAPRVESAGEGRVIFAFRRRMAPRRGEYAVRVAYRTSLAHRATEVDGGDVRVRWTLPSWRYGLDDVSITIDAPEGARYVPGEGDDGTVEIARSALEGGRARIVLRRVHLPRTREWTAVIAVPAAAMAASLRAPLAARPAAPPPPRAADDGGGSEPIGLAGLAVLLALLALAKIHLTARAAEAARAAPSPVVPLGAGPRSVLVVALGTGACAVALAGLDGLSGPALALAALSGVAALALHRRGGAPRAPRLGSFRPASQGDLRAARRALLRERLGPAAWLDPSCVPGAALLAAICAAPLLAWAEGALPVPLPTALAVAALASAIVLGGSRRALPSPPLVDLAHLLAIARRARADLASERRFALRPVLHADVRGEPQEARLRVVLGTTPKGLLRLDVVRAIAAGRAQLAHATVLLIVAREGSPADRALAERFPASEIARAPRRVARQLALGDLGATLEPVLEALATCPIESTPGGRAEGGEPALAASA